MLLLREGTLPLETVRIAMLPSCELCEKGLGEDSPGNSGLGRGVISIMALSAGDPMEETAGDSELFIS